MLKILVDPQTGLLVRTNSVGNYCVVQYIGNRTISGPSALFQNSVSIMGNVVAQVAVNLPAGATDEDAETLIADLNDKGAVINSIYLAPNVSDEVIAANVLSERQQEAAKTDPEYFVKWRKTNVVTNSKQGRNEWYRVSKLQSEAVATRFFAEENGKLVSVEAPEVSVTHD